LWRMCAISLTLTHTHTTPHTTARTTPARILPHMRVRHPNCNEMHTTEKGQRVCRIRTASLEGGAAGSWMGRAKILTSTTRAPRADETVRPGVTGAQHRGASRRAPRRSFAQHRPIRSALIHPISAKRPCNAILGHHTGRVAIQRPTHRITISCKQTPHRQTSRAAHTHQPK